MSCAKLVSHADQILFVFFLPFCLFGFFFYVFVYFPFVLTLRFGQVVFPFVDATREIAHVGSARIEAQVVFVVAIFVFSFSRLVLPPSYSEIVGEMLLIN